MDRTANYEDIAGLQNRVSWGAIFAGSVIALAVYLMLSLFFAGVGLALPANGVQGETTAWLGLAAGAIALIGSLFLGGYITTVLTAGENRQEAVIHGILTWAVVTALAMAMVGMGMKAGYNAVLGAGLAANSANESTGRTWEQAARDAGVPPERIEQWKQNANPENVRAQLNDPRNRDEVRRGAMTAAWVMLAATMLSVGAAIWGAVVGSGPTFRLLPIAVVERSQTAVRS